MKITALLATLSLLFCFTGRCAVAEAPASQSISVMKPGVGLGNVTLGDSIPEVIIKMNGKKPDDGKTVRIDSTAEYWLTYLDLGITFIFDGRKKLSRIAVKNPAIVVQQNGLRVNSTGIDMERAYGKGELTKLDEVYDQIAYRERGITFTLDKKRAR